jgi:hypothetical protein
VCAAALVISPTLDLNQPAPFTAVTASSPSSPYCETRNILTSIGFEKVALLRIVELVCASEENIHTV